jgi:hypothetical protein
MGGPKDATLWLLSPDPRPVTLTICSRGRVLWGFGKQDAVLERRDIEFEVEGHDLVFLSRFGGMARTLVERRAEV